MQTTDIRILTDLARKAYERTLADIPRWWKPNREEWQNMRYWAIFADGQVHKVPMFNLPFLGGFDAKSVMALAATAWCDLTRPVGLVLGVEFWCCEISHQQSEALRRAEGGTPSMMDPANRERLIVKYGGKVYDGLMVFGETVGRAPDCVFYPIKNDKLGDGIDWRKDLSAMSSRFEGVLDGNWSPKSKGWR